MVQYTEEQRRAWLASLEKRTSSAAVIIENELGEVLCLKSDYKQHWALPGGVIDAGETPIKAAVREVREEIGFNIAPDDMQPIMTACRKGDVVSYQFIFLAKVPTDCLSIDKLRLQESEVEQARFFSREEVNSGLYPLLWAVRAYMNGQRGYFETEVPLVYDGAKERIVRNQSYV